jgi:hypothetical protein
LRFVFPRRFKLENDVWLAIAVVGAGLIVIAVCIILTHESGVSWISSPGHIRATIAVSIVTEYMVLVGVVAFFHGWSDATTPAVTQTLVTNFTSIVGVVVAFFFGASAYVQTRDARSQKAKEARSQKAKSEDRDDPQN